MSNLKNLAVLFSGVCLVAGCQQVPPPPPPAEPPPPPPVVAEVASQPEAPAAPVLQPYPAAQIPKAFASAVTSLELGHEDQAKVELQRILLGDPNNAKAKRLLAGITGDPVAMLGRESFPYTVRANDSMSSIAGRFLGDIYSFYVLARYNGIAVPRQLAEGQTLRIPGKAPPPGALAPPPAPPKAEAPAPAPAASKPDAVTAPPPAPAPPAVSAGTHAMQSGQAAEARGDLDGAFAAYQQAAAVNEPGAAAKADGVRKRLVQRNSLNARTAFAKQDLDGAIRGWDSVLAVDPDNETAKLERQRALTLKAKVDSLKK